MLRTILLGFLTVLGLGLLNDPVFAQSRQFYCGEDNVVTVALTGGETITVGPIDGQTLSLQQNPLDPRRFFAGDYGLTLSPDGKLIAVEIPGFGVINCAYGSGDEIPIIPPSGSAPAAATPARSAEGPTRQFFCGEGSFVTVTELGQGSISAGPIDGQTMVMAQSPAADSLYFFNDYGLTVAENGREIVVDIPGEDTIECVFASGDQPPSAPEPVEVVVAPPPVEEEEADPEFPIEARSWGGTVRSGPGISFQRLGSLPRGEPIVVLERSEAPEYQDYQWFRISYRGRTGYHWGGIICGRDEPIDGASTRCN